MILARPSLTHTFTKGGQGQTKCVVACRMHSLIFNASACGAVLFSRHSSSAGAAPPPFLLKPFRFPFPSSLAPPSSPSGSSFSQNASSFSSCSSKENCPTLSCDERILSETDATHGTEPEHGSFVAASPSCRMASTSTICRWDLSHRPCPPLHLPLMRLQSSDVRLLHLLALHTTQQTD